MSETVVNPHVYQENIDFWDRAWNGVRAPYTQLPDLEYLPKILEIFQNAKPGPILDLGCGSGWLSVFLARNGFDAVGVDLAAHAIELGKMWAEQESLKIDFQVQDISHLTFADKSFAGIIANSIFEHLTYELAEQTATKLKALLKDGGVFFGCFDMVGTGPGEYYKLEDGTHVYTDKGRKGMLLRCFSDEELKRLFADWQIKELSTLESGARILIATK
ncbi:MAG: class I SAM-dependent methyltransferase [Candidatus Obscuribacterales bacterium]|jgi:SAM-dependent methyltransferase|nr:class I SAM-dependent methyltransferase [Candidatus Obscuribacterales bacterium]